MYLPYYTTSTTAIIQIINLVIINRKSPKYIDFTASHAFQPIATMQLSRSYQQAYFYACKWQLPDILKSRPHWRRSHQKVAALFVDIDASVDKPLKLIVDKECACLWPLATTDRLFSFHRISVTSIALCVKKLHFKTLKMLIMLSSVQPGFLNFRVKIPFPSMIFLRKLSYRLKFTGGEESCPGPCHDTTDKSHACMPWPTSYRAVFFTFSLLGCNVSASVILSVTSQLMNGDVGLHDVRRVVQDNKNSFRNARSAVAAVQTAQSTAHGRTVYQSEK